MKKFLVIGSLVLAVGYSQKPAVDTTQVVISGRTNAPETCKNLM